MNKQKAAEALLARISGQREDSEDRADKLLSKLTGTHPRREDEKLPQRKTDRRLSDEQRKAKR